MSTYFIANNKTRVCAILQTSERREEVLHRLDFNLYDVFVNCDLSYALELRDRGDYKLGSFSDFYK